MDQQPKNAGGGVLALARGVAKWWADRLDGTVIETIIPECVQDNISLLEIICPKCADKIKGNWEGYTSLREEFLHENAYLFPLQRERFVNVLTAYIVKEIENKQYANLYTDEDGPQGILWRAAYESEIDLDEKGPLNFHMDMWVDCNGAEVRYCDEDKYHPVDIPKELGTGKV